MECFFDFLSNSSNSESRFSPAFFDVDKFVETNCAIYAEDVVFTTNYDYALELSGRKLKEAKEELALLRAKEQSLRIWIDSALLLNYFHGLESSASEFSAIEDFYNEVQSASWLSSTSFFTTFEKSLLTASRVRKRIQRLARYVKAVKRGLRARQQITYCGIDLSKRAWFLMHISHPPDFVSTSYVSTLSGRD